MILTIFVESPPERTWKTTQQQPTRLVGGARNSACGKEGPNPTGDECVQGPFLLPDLIATAEKEEEGRGQIATALPPFSPEMDERIPPPPPRPFSSAVVIMEWHLSPPPPPTTESLKPDWRREIDKKACGSHPAKQSLFTNGPSQSFPFWTAQRLVNLCGDKGRYYSALVPLSVACGGGERREEFTK